MIGDPAFLDHRHVMETIAQRDDFFFRYRHGSTSDCELIEAGSARAWQQVRPRRPAGQSETADRLPAAYRSVAADRVAAFAALHHVYPVAAQICRQSDDESRGRRS